MRHWLLVLLIALLPLRGWAAEAMAGRMLAQQLDAIEFVATQHHSTGASGNSDSGMATQAMADCPGHAAAAAAASAVADVAVQDSDPCASCLQCQACSILALQPGATPLAGPVPSHHAAAAGTARFASALSTPALKPPIA
ncbi:hypothetical protein [uncultured Ramlibacter sp.]|uniref:hypothetical protein n=1 Tax=uncultured Ramlibacter sp. TaxID=260755 RepID=UPI0026199D08|nr:hypothetical protein [uncultured Ramlibacter sp.]